MTDLPTRFLHSPDVSDAAPGSEDKTLASLRLAVADGRDGPSAEAAQDIKVVSQYYDGKLKKYVSKVFSPSRPSAPAAQPVKPASGTSAFMPSGK